MVLDPAWRTDLPRRIARGPTLGHDPRANRRPWIATISGSFGFGRRAPDPLRPRANLRVDPAIRGGEPVTKDTRVPFADVAALVRDGVRPDQIVDDCPGVSAAAATDASDFADCVDSYAPRRVAA